MKKQRHPAKLRIEANIRRATARKRRAREKGKPYDHEALVDRALKATDHIAEYQRMEYTYRRYRDAAAVLTAWRLGMLETIPRSTHRRLVES